MADTPDIWQLLSTVFQSILEVFLLCLAGYILAWRHIIDKPIQRVINRINISLFTPALLFSKVAFFLSPAKLRELWIIPIFFLVVTSFSALVAVILSKLFRLNRSQRNFAMAASMFMNSNSLPIALMQSLVLSVHDLKWTPDDNTHAMLGRALTYLVLYSTLGMMLRWSYGVRLLSSVDTPEIPTSLRSPSILGAQYADDVSMLDEETLGGLSTSPSHHWQTQAQSTNHSQTQSYPTNPSHHWQTQIQIQSLSSHLDDDDDGDTTCETPALLPVQNSTPSTQLHLPPPPAHELPRSSSHLHSRSPHHPKTTVVYHSFPNSPSRVLAPLSSISVTPADSDDEDIAIQQHQRHTGVRYATHRIWKGTKKILRRINGFMTMPLWASLLSLVVACIAPLQSALDRMTPVKGALTAAGSCSIPLTLVVLGAYFCSEPSEKGLQNGNSIYPETDEMRPHIPHPKSRSPLLSAFQMFVPQRAPQSQPESHAEDRTVLVAVLARMVVVPAVMLPIMALLAKFDLNDIFDDPVFVVSNVLLIASPPALTLAQMTHAAANDSFERLISRTVFWSYCVVTPPSTILVVVLGLLIAKL